MMESVVEHQLVTAAQQLELQVDDELARLERLDADDIENIRRRRLEQMRRNRQLQQEWRQNGHGEYTEIPEEKDFFEVPKKSDNVVCHFYRDDFFRCKIVDKHLAILATKHMETKFVKINAEKCPFLTKRLNIKVLPSIALVKQGKTKDYIVGFQDLGNTDEFSTEMLEWRIAQAGVLEYAGDLLVAPDQAGTRKTVQHAKKSKKKIRGGDDDSSDSSDGY